jgi:hypothetical protein
MSAKTLEHADAMALDRPHAQAEIPGDHLIRLSGNETIEHLLFARTERGEARGGSHCLLVVFRMT